MKRLLDHARSPFARLSAAAAGLGVVFLLLRHAGMPEIAAALSRALALFPAVLALEAGILACSTLALRSLYLEERDRIPARAFARAGLIGYAVMGLVPAGRTAAEASRAAMLSRHATGARAIVAAARMQGVALLANAAISVPVVVAFALVSGASVPTALAAGNLLLAGALGLGILLAGESSRLGAWLGRRFPSARGLEPIRQPFPAAAGQEPDQRPEGGQWLPLASLKAPFRWELLGRIIQIAQYGVLIAAVGGKPGAVTALCSEGVHLVGAAAGDLVPAQLGATELGFRVFGSWLGLRAADALAIPLLAHLAQLFWVVVGLLSAVFWPAMRGETQLESSPAGATLIGS